MNPINHVFALYMGNPREVIKAVNKRDPNLKKDGVRIKRIKHLQTKKPLGSNIYWTRNVEGILVTSEEKPPIPRIDPTPREEDAVAGIGAYLEKNRIPYEVYHMQGNIIYEEITKTRSAKY